MAGGAVTVAVGTGLMLLALATTSTPAFFFGTAIAGAGFGTAFLGAFRSVTLLAEPAERAGLFASMYIVSYLAFSVPAVIAGEAVPPLGLRITATAYGLVVIVLALVAVLPRISRSDVERSSAGPE
jgi:hypothetical protein